MGDVLDLGKRKWQTNKTCIPKEENPAKVYTCNCGCQIFQVYDFGDLVCIACNTPHPTLEVFQ